MPPYHSLSGDKAYELFTSDNAKPLHDFLQAWKLGKIKGHPGYILAVIGAFKTMCDNCNDGRYKGVRRTLPIH